MLVLAPAIPSDIKLLTKVTEESDEDVESASRVCAWAWDRDLAIFSKCLDLVPANVTLRASLAAAVNLCLLGWAGGIVDEDDDTAGAWIGESLSLTSMTLRALGLDELALANLLRSDDIFIVWRSVLYWGNGSSAARTAVAPFTLTEVSVSVQRNLSISLWRSLGQRLPTLF